MSSGTHLSTLLTACFDKTTYTTRAADVAAAVEVLACFRRLPTQHARHKLYFFLKFALSIFNMCVSESEREKEKVSEKNESANFCCTCRRSF